MVRDCMAAAVAEFLGSFRAEAETVVRLDRINAFEISRPVFLPPLLVLHYAGSRPLSGHYWRDAFAENVHMCGFFDQRDIERFADRLDEALRDVPAGAAAPVEIGRASCRERGCQDE